MAEDTTPPAQLSPPPKFQSQTNPIIGPQTPAEWADFWRWLYSQYLTVAYLSGSNVPPSSFPSQSVQQVQKDSRPGQFPALPSGAPAIGDLVAMAAGFQPAPPARETDAPAQGFPPSPYVTRRPIEIIICTQATFPTLTGTQATFVFVTDYVHLIYWNGTACSFAGDQSGCISLWESNPGTGYQLCDGSTVNRLNADGTITSVTVPDFTTATFLEGGLANSGPTAAAAPTFTGNAATPTGSVSAPIFTGIPAPITTDLFTPVALATAAMTSLDGSTTSYTPAGTNSAPTFTGNIATPTGTISATAEPRKLIRRPYFRQ